MPLLIVFSISLTSLVLHLANFIKTKQNKTKMLVGQVCSCSPEFQKISSSSEFQAIRPHCLPRFLGTVIPYSLRFPVINPIFSFSSCPYCHCWWRQCLCCVSICYHFYSRLLALISSVQFSRSVVSDSLRPHEPPHARPPWPSPTPGVHPKPCPSGRWCHPIISSSVIPFSSCLQSFPTSGSFQMSQLFASMLDFNSIFTLKAMS